jgi:uncharacterized membrane protein YbaN (DUF454 family)
MLAVALGAVGVFLPLLPTVPFLILAAFCFARSSPELERRLVEHPVFGPSIQTWRSRGAISRRGKIAASVTFAVSALVALLWMEWPLVLVPLLALAASCTWVLSRPTG